MRIKNMNTEKKVLLSIGLITVLISIGIIISAGGLSIITKPFFNIRNKLMVLTCSKYHFSTCPSYCIAICTPSFCEAGGACTGDCDGQNSCK